MTDENRPEANEEELIDATEAEAIEDPVGDVTDGEGKDSLGAESEAEIEAAEDDAFTAAEDEPGIKTEDAEEDDAEPESRPRPPAKLERLQKILAAAGVASRRKAEEMIEQGRVQLNGKVVTALGTKADAGRDHIRVDGKLLHGAERLRYFVLNKPRGFVTTVKDPEGRPTVMQFFDKMRERLYPVGRLDYMSEGLLLVTNDGELANKLTRASAGVEKTYLVKVAGIPSESELDILRAGVAIEKGKPGSDKVRTSPARIRQVRQGDNPWYEVVLIEGRNRELRKMFEEVGHFVEKIRRVGYGPLILDQEPGHLRELDPQELELLRKAADGKLRTPKAKEIRRRNLVDSLPPEKAAIKARGAKPAAGPKDYQPKRSFGADKSFGSARPVPDGPARIGAGPAKFGSGPAKFEKGPAKFGTGRPPAGQGARPAWKKDDRAGLPPARFGAGSTAEGRPPADRSFGARPTAGRADGRPAAGRSFDDKPAGRTFGARPGGSRPFGDRPASGRSFPPKPAWKKPEAAERPPYKRPTGYKPPAGPRSEATRRPAPEPIDDPGPRKPFKLHIEPVQDFGRDERSKSSRPASSRPPSGYSSRSDPGRSRPGSSGGGRSGTGRSGAGSGASPSGSSRPFRGEGGLARPFTTSSGKPRAGGARPNSKPGSPAGRSYGAGVGRSDDSRPERRSGTGWKPKPNFTGKAGTGKSGPGSSDRSKSRPGGFSKSGYKGKPSGSGAKRSGPRPGGKRPGGKRP
jgi:23S rRNA pseudouridine2605 synthase